MRSGLALIYLLVVFTVLIGFVSFGVDWGRIQTTKMALYTAADAASRYAATGLSDGTAVTKAITAAQSNTADGSSVVLLSSDVLVGVWNAGTRSFTATNVSPNAVKVTAQRTAARGTAIPTMFAAVLGRQTVDATAVAIATYTPASSVNNTVFGLANIWLAGMPSGTTANWYDSAPTDTPTTFQGITITPGAIININFAGTISNAPAGTGTLYPPDGDPTWIVQNVWASSNGDAEHGIANIHGPAVCMIGVFLDGSRPDSTAAPASLDFSTVASRDFATIAPLLKQPFFIGDGYRDDGVTKQNIIVPTGATRLFMGTLDGYEYSNNSGSVSATVVNPAVISTVK